MSRCDSENSQISVPDTVGVAGDDTMFHILVLSVIFIVGTKSEFERHIQKHCIE